MIIKINNLDFNIVKENERKFIYRRSHHIQTYPKNTHFEKNDF